MSNENASGGTENLFCAHGTKLETIRAHFDSWRQFRNSTNSETEARISAPCEVCFLRNQVLYYKTSWELSEDRNVKNVAENTKLLALHNSYRAMMLDLSGSAGTLSIHYLDKLEKALDSFSLDEMLEHYNMHAKQMEVYAQLLQSKHNKVNLKKASEEFNETRKKRIDAELTANKEVTPKIKIPSEPKAKATPKTQLEKMLAGIMKVYKCDETKAREIAAPMLRMMNPAKNN